MEEKIKEILKRRFDCVECFECAHNCEEDRKYYCDCCCGTKRFYWRISSNLIDSIAKEISQVVLDGETNKQS